MGLVYEHSAALVIAICSVVLYTALLLSSLQQLHVHCYLKKSLLGGSFIEFKIVFFSVLAMSALFSLPLWVVCLVAGSPSNCEWHGPSYYTCWSFHLLALIGFSFCVGIPSIMWSDIINNTQRLHPGATVSFLGSFRRIFTVPLGSGGQGIGVYYDYSDPSSTSPTNLCRPCSGIRVDYMRLTFVIFVCCYSVNELVVIASFIQFYIQDRNVTDFVEHSNLYRVSTYIEPFIIIFFAGNCLFSGISLQMHVRRARLEQSMQRKLLTTLNSVLLVVTITYITRAVFVLDLFLEFSRSLTFSYFVWILCTHWMPHLLGSSCLFYLMSSQGNERKHRGKVYKGEGVRNRARSRSKRYAAKSKKKTKKKSKTDITVSRSRSKTRSTTSIDKENLMSKFSINSEVSQNSSVLDGSTNSQGDDMSTPYSPLLRYEGEDDDNDDGDDSSLGSSRQGESVGEYSTDEDDGDDDNRSDYDSFYDPYDESQSEDGGAMARLSRRETFGNGVGADLGDDISSDGGLSALDNNTMGNGHRHSYFSSSRSSASQSRFSQT